METKKKARQKYLEAVEPVSERCSEDDTSLTSTRNIEFQFVNKQAQDNENDPF